MEKEILKNNTDEKNITTIENTPAYRVDPRKILRTYESDVADLIARKKASVATIAIAEQEKRADSPSSKKEGYSEKSAGPNLIKLFIGIILLFGGVGLGYFLYQKSPLAKKEFVETKSVIIPGIVIPDSQNIIQIDSINYNSLVKVINNESKNAVENGSLHEIILSFIDSDSIQKRISGEQFLNVLNLQPPDIFKRSTGVKFLFGFINENDRKNPIIIFTNTFFQNSFAGILEWENSLPDQLDAVFGIRNISNSPLEDNVPINNEDKLNSPPASFFGINGDWEDRVINNKDARVFIDSDDNLLLIYSFIDKETLIITTNIDSFKNILGRIEKETFVR